VRATLETMFWGLGYVLGVSREGLMLAIVTTANRARIPTTTNTIRLCTRATSVDPATLRNVITITAAAAKSLAASGSLLAKAELA
jgi:hypothetical protein